MHFRLSSRLAKSVKAKCRTISHRYVGYRRNRKIAKSTKFAVVQIPQTQQGGANPSWQGEPYRFANDGDDWEQNLASDYSESDYDSGCAGSISVQEGDLRCEYDVDSFIEWWLRESSLILIPSSSMPAGY